MHQRPDPGRSNAPPANLLPLPDRPDCWLNDIEPVPFDAGAERILAAHRRDGARDDVFVDDLRAWSFGAGDRETMALIGPPVPGRGRARTFPLRELAFEQLCDRVGAPAFFVRRLPVKLQLACMNWGLFPIPGRSRPSAGRLPASRTSCPRRPTRGP